MRKRFLFLGISAMAIAASAIVFQLQLFKSIQETITFFPIDESVHYQTANTTLTLLKDKKNNQHQVDWKVNSALDREAYLRQDLGLLFINGLLKGKMAKWEQDTSDLSQGGIISTGESGRYDAITFHYSELHGNSDRISSSQRMSEDRLYVIDSQFSPLSSFRVPNSKEEREWKQVLDRSTENRLNKSLLKAAKNYGVNLSNYIAIPLYEIRKYEDQPIMGYSQRETANILGRLWEGLYKNYYLGIKKSDGTVVDSLDSTIPLILISKDKSHLLAVFQTKDGESIILKQLL
ncbi:hypothetical protein AABM38_16580 [Heyndrickxia sp. MSNUG]|uniref:hypothetical protein n=1 Tax=Heyndrickxia sp. MSNUG TaxID=3136677 RepID=UPI003C2B4AC7